MLSNWIVDGDTTDHGGRVSVPDAIITANGHNVASVGDKVHCPKCNVVATIIQGSDLADMNGSAIAHVGGLTSCGARLVSINQDIARFGTEEKPSKATPTSDDTKPVAVGEPVCEPCLREAAAEGRGFIERE